LHAFSRTELLIGAEALARLSQSKIAIFGIGGVGSFTAEGLARSGVGKFVLVDDDTICLTNLNRQIHASHKTIGQVKVEAMKGRILAINPQAEVVTFQRFYLPECAEELIMDDYDYIVDAVDTVTAKLDLAERAYHSGIPIISAMGAGNKLDPTRFEVADIYQTSVCPLAKVMRQELRKRGIPKLKVVYSKEDPIHRQEHADGNQNNTSVCPPDAARNCTAKRQIPGSISFVPSVAGLIIAGEVIKDIIGLRKV